MKIQTIRQITLLTFVLLTLFTSVNADEKVLDSEIKKLLAGKSFSEKYLKREMKNHGWQRSFEGLVIALENSDPKPPKDDIAFAYLTLKNVASNIRLDTAKAESAEALESLTKRIQKAIRESQ